MSGVGIVKWFAAIPDLPTNAKVPRPCRRWSPRSAARSSPRRRSLLPGSARRRHSDVGLASAGIRPRPAYAGARAHPEQAGHSAGVLAETQKACQAELEKVLANQGVAGRYARPANADDVAGRGAVRAPCHRRKVTGNGDRDSHPPDPNPRAAPAQRESRAGLLFILPWLIALLVFTTYPVLGHLLPLLHRVQSSSRHPGSDSTTTSHVHCGSGILDGRAATAPSTRSSRCRSSWCIAFGLALLLNMGVRGIGVYRTIFYLPTLVPPMAATIIFILLFSPAGGPINTIFCVGRNPRPGLVQRPESGRCRR